jgi:hypothetical protein
MASLSSHEMGSSSLSHSMIAHPIMAPKELYQHGEEEAATLRIRQRAKGKADVALWRERANQVPGTSSPVREVEKELMSSRRKNSPTVGVFIHFSLAVANHYSLVNGTLGCASTASFTPTAREQCIHREQHGHQV